MQLPIFGKVTLEKYAIHQKPHQDCNYPIFQHNIMEIINLTVLDPEYIHMRYVFVQHIGIFLDKSSSPHLLLCIIARSIKSWRLQKRERNTEQMSRTQCCWFNLQQTRNSKERNKQTRGHHLSHSPVIMIGTESGLRL